MDAVVPWYLGRTLVLDDTFVDTLAESYIRITALKSAAAADQAQILKRRKCANIIQ